MIARIAPSVLSADFCRLGDDIAMLEAGGADLIHVDVMDGRFVPSLSFGGKVIDAVKRSTTLPIDVHLMIVEPEKHFDEYAKSGANIITIHTEVAPHLDRQLTRIKELGCKAGLAINPGTSLDVIEEVAHLLDLLLIMSVNPGYGGQKFIEYTVDKIARARWLLDQADSDAMLEVDGGISRETIGRCFDAGADTFVAGNAIFSAADPKAEIDMLRSFCKESA